LIAAGGNVLGLFAAWTLPREPVERQDKSVC